MSQNKILATIAGIGAILFAIHNLYQPLLDIISLPAIGMILLICAVVYYLMLNKGKLDLGEKIVWIPLLTIALSIGISGFWNGGLVEGFALTVFGLTLFAVYVIARAEGESFTKPFMWIVIVGTIGVVAWSITSPGVKSGGWVISPTNYDIIAGVLVLGTVISAVKKQWWLSGIAVTGLLLSGSEEGLFALAVLCVVVLIRRDWSKKILLPAGIAIFLLLVSIPLGITQKLYTPTAVKIAAAREAIDSTPIERERLLSIATGNRLMGNWKLSELKPFGHGYILFEYYKGIPHNAGLVIIEQVGILAVIAWLWIIGYCLVKGGRKYLIVSVLALGVFDHFIWTQIAPWWWIAIGIATTHQGKDYIFRKEIQNA